MTKIIQITDLHLSNPDETLWGLSPHKRLISALEDIASFHSDAKACVITGDLTDGASLKALLWLRQILADFPITTYLMIGNHDVRSVFFEAFANYPRDKNGFLQYSFDIAENRFFCLDTKKDDPVSSGQYCEERLAWLEVELQRTEKDVYIFMHHPPFDIGLPYMDRIKLDEAVTFGKLIANYKNIRHIFFGHVHRAVFLKWQGITCSACPGINHQVPLVSGSVLTNYSIEPPMYAVIELLDGDVRVNLDAYQDRQPVLT